jgi:hypothetical protein
MRPMPIRIQRQRTRGFNLQACSPDGRPVVYVGRPTALGNPFRVGGFFMLGDPDGRKDWMGMVWCENVSGRPDARFTLIENHAMAVAWHVAYRERYPPSEALRATLRGKHLSCWCPLAEPCHADWLLAWANA